MERTPEENTPITGSFSLPAFFAPWGKPRNALLFSSCRNCPISCPVCQNTADLHLARG